MKELNLLIWVMQLGFSIATPMALCIIGSNWLRDRFQLGNWIMIAGIIIGLYCAVDGFVRNLKALDRMNSRTRHNKDDQEKDLKNVPTFNDHD